ncbi:MAG: hypothetical protein HC854_17370 [Flavobacterium sp.]|nr:hypothetical protein [Flavobacterium sp.]
MKTNLQIKNYILFLFLFVSLLSFSQKKQKIKGDNVYATKVIELDSVINKILIRDDLEVSLSFMNNSNSIYLTGDQNILDTLNFKVVDGFLEVGTNFKLLTKKKLKIELNLTSINELEVIEGAKINQIGSYTTDTFKLTSKGNAKLILTFKQNILKVIFK